MSTTDSGKHLPPLGEEHEPEWWQAGAANAPIDSLALLVGSPYEESEPLTGQARHDAIDAARAAERAAETKEQQHQNEHDPERDETRGVTKCRRCGRLLGMDARPEFRQLHPCSVLRA